MIGKFQFAAFKLDSEHHRFQHHPKPKHTIFKFSWSLAKKHMGVDFLVIRGVHQYMQKQKKLIFFKKMIAGLTYRISPDSDLRNCVLLNWNHRKINLFRIVRAIAKFQQISIRSLLSRMGKWPNSFLSSSYFAHLIS